MRFLVCIAFICAAFGARAETPVDVELMLAVDVSYSINQRELKIQRRGYAEALRHPRIVEAIETGYHQRIAVTYVEWSDSYAQRVVVPWTLITTGADLDAFAGRLIAERRPGLRRTSISGLLEHAPKSFETNGFAGERRIIDISGDGPNNMGRPVVAARDEVVAQGYVINGLPLMTREGAGNLFQLDDIDLYYAECVIGGPGAFTVPVKSWEEFPEAVRRKLVLELAGGDAYPPFVPVAWKGKTKDGYDCLIGEKIWRNFMEQNSDF